MFLHKHNTTAGLLLESASLCGFLIHAYILYKVIYGKIFGRTFGLLWRARGFAHCSESAMFVLFIGPVTLLDPLLFDHLQAQRVLHFNYLFKTAIIAMNLLIALNRAVMVAKPMIYKICFSRPRTITLILIGWLIAVSVATPNVIHPCQQTPLNSSLSYYTHRPECSLSIHLLDIYTPVVLGHITLIANVVTLYKLYRLPATRKGLSLVPVSMIRSRELRLCYMILTEVAVAAIVISSLRLGHLIEEPFPQFMLTSFMWSAWSAFDGAIVIMFVRKMHLQRPRKAESTKITSLSYSNVP